MFYSRIAAVIITLLHPRYYFSCTPHYRISSPFSDAANLRLAGITWKWGQRCRYVCYKLHPICAPRLLVSGNASVVRRTFENEIISLFESVFYSTIVELQQYIRGFVAVVLSGDSFNKTLLRVCLSLANNTLSLCDISVLSHPRFFYTFCSQAGIRSIWN